MLSHNFSVSVGGFQWNPALVCMCCQIFGSGIIALFGFFVNPLSVQFNVSVATLGLGPSLIFVSTALISPILGIQVDKINIRNILLTGVIVAGLALMAISQATSLWSVTLCFFIFCCAFVGYGPMVCNSLLTKTYQNHLPRALGISALGISISSVVLPPFCAFLLNYFQWQQTLAILGMIITGLLGLLISISVKQPPHSAEPKPAESTKTTQKHYKSKVFWLIGIGFAILLSVPILSIFSLVPHFQQLGYSATDAAWFVSLMGAAGMAGKIALVLWSDRIRAYLKWGISLVIVLGAIGYLLIALSSQTPILILACILVGLCVGISLPMQPFLNSIYFDKTIAGAVNGQQAPLFLPLGIAIAPLSGWVFDTTGNYSIAFTGAGVVTLCALILLLQLPSSTKTEGKYIDSPLP